MARPKKTEDTSEETTPKRRVRRARTTQQRENQLIALAMDAAEEQMRNGTASPAVITHYLKLGTEKYRYENEKLRKENEMLTAKTEAIASQKRVEELYEDAIAAFRSYGSGT